ncbi:hypothetical protein OOU_Y34scaffold00126g25 [Pyricularia oryzae Y34]|uniref:DUF676 domain-containing protein n=2 Tax=Pyricularia oryzae TaxID=318829 RepID=A0AA97PR42_PYRO3|nr:hypothetical protein OOU_Y34scaffold00126g25 [Pyricularia oryzae Y34]
MGTINRQVSRYEVSAVYTHPDAKVDIVLVHGLNGDPQKTWTARTNGVYWPADLLPVSLKKQHANILVYGYNADVYSTRNDRSASDNFIHVHAQTLIATLTNYRKSEETTQNPIIWVAHSLGGILVKRALLYSNDVRNTAHAALRSIYVSTYGIIFLGTPHTGSDVAQWAGVLQHMSDAVVPKRFFESESVLLKTLKRDNETLQNINSHFLDVYQRFKIHMAHENHKTDIKGHKVIIVDANSASPQLPGVIYYGIEATHSGMAKFDSDNAPGYRMVSTTLREWVTEAPNVIQVRWGVEDEERQARARNDINEQIRAFRPPQSASGQSRSSASETFRPNSYNIGREEEMRDLHKKLMDKGRRAYGTSAVLIQCLPGGGKTHLARQYVFKHKADYSGGVYWVRAKSIPEMEHWFWRIAKTEAIRDSLEDVAGGAVDDELLRDPSRIVDIVRAWFETFDDWLLVFDGIQFDAKGTERFIPSRPGTSIIFTSTDAAVGGDHQFDNPQVMELNLLPVQEAQELLLLEMEKPRPWSQDDRSRAMELVQLMGRLPLMIHVAAQHLKTTREPLSKYLRSYRSRPKVGSLPAYRAVYDQLHDRGANAALNLMSILVFFDSHLPVEMIALVLIMFALIERIESDDISPTSSRSSRQSFDRNVEYLDILRVHSVVQAFFVETLAEEKQHVFWLERAVAVFCRSYDEADNRVKHDPKIGLPDDYRRFHIHGRKLLDHVERFEKKAADRERLVKSRKALELRSGLCHESIISLTQKVQAHIVLRTADEAPPSSVFERNSGSLSETDSGTPNSQQSLSGVEQWVPVLDNDNNDLGTYHQSPTAVAAPLDYVNPYHFHVPVPYPEKQTIPAPPFVADADDTGTVVPAVPSPRIDPATPGIEEATSAVLNSPRSPPWQLVTHSPQHRTVKKNEGRRYHDRAGAWRDRTVSDPRSSVSRETAKGSRYDAQIHAQHGGSTRRTSVAPETTAESGARMILNKLKQTSPAGGAVAEMINDVSVILSGDDKTVRSVSHTTGTPVRPKLRIDGANGHSYASVAAGRPRPIGNTTATGPDIRGKGIGHNDEPPTSPGEFHNEYFKTVASPPSSWTEKTQNALQRFRENIKPRSRASSERLNSRGPSVRRSSNGTAKSHSRGSSVSSTRARPPRRPWSDLSRKSSSDLLKHHRKTNSESPIMVVAESPPDETRELSLPGSKVYSNVSSPALAPQSNISSPPLAPSTLFAGSRSTKSSPGQITSPFSPPGLPFERQTRGSVASGGPQFQPFPSATGGSAVPGSVQRWDTDLPLYSPGRARIPSSELLETLRDEGDYGEGIMTRSTPSIRNSTGGYQYSAAPVTGYPPKIYGRRQDHRASGGPHQYPYILSVQPPQAPYPPSPDGYTSLPMSRNPSGETQPQKQQQSLAPMPVRHTPPVPITSTRSSPTGASNGGLNTSRGACPHGPPYMYYGYDAGGSRSGSGSVYSHAPSDVRTEPSPRMGPAFPDIHTSYQRYEERHSELMSPGRHRAGSGSLLAGNPAAAASASIRSTSPASGSVARGRRSPVVPVKFGAPPGQSPDLVQGGEAMARSGSSPGGLKLGDGRFIEFGKVPVDVIAAGQRVRKYERERSRGRDGDGWDLVEGGSGTGGGELRGLGITE